MAKALYISQAEVSYALLRMEKSRLYDKVNGHVQINNFLEFLGYGFSYVFPAEVVGEKIGIALQGLDAMHQNRPDLVWEYADGSSLGKSIKPLLYDNMPKAIIHDEYLRKVISYIEWIRIGSAREKDLAFNFLKAQWSAYGK